MAGIKSKKAGVTLFIILGIIIVLGVSLGIAYKDDIGQFFTEAGNADAKKVRLFIEDCTEKASENALRLVALQGGYTTIPLKIEARGAYIPPEPTTFKTPLWWYKGKSYMPAKNEMETDIGDYVVSKVTACIDNFNAFPEIDINVKGDLSAEVNLNKKSVFVGLDYPIEVQKPGKQGYSKLYKFSKTIESDFLRLYNIAKAILEKENKEAFLEDLTMDMIAVADGAGDSPHFPFEGFDIRCGSTKRWSKQTQLIPDLQDMIKYNFHFLSFENTGKDFVITDEENRVIELDICEQEDSDTGLCKISKKEEARLFDYYDAFYNFDIGVGNNRDVVVKTIYSPEFGMDLDVEPSKGDTVKGMDLKIPILGSCIKYYHHKYWIDYPLMFQLRSPTTIFNFATQVSIANNAPNRFISQYSLGDYVYHHSSDDYCGNRQFKQRIFVEDKYGEGGDKFLDGAEIRYDCVRFSCGLGKTAVPEDEGIPRPGAIPVLETAFPACINGFLTAEKQGYLPETKQITIDSEYKNIPPLELTPLHELEVKAMVVEFIGDKQILRPLEEDEMVFIVAANDKHDYEDSTFYPGNEFTQNDPFELIYGDNHYIIDIKLIKDQLPVGGIYLEDWQVTRSDLSSADILALYIISSTEEITNMDEFVQFWKDTVIPKSAEFAPILK